MIDILLILSCFLRVDMMIDEWQDNIKPFTKSTERSNDTKKLRENIRFKTTGINVDKLTSTLILCFYYSLQWKKIFVNIWSLLQIQFIVLLERWQSVSDDPGQINENKEDDANTKTGYILNLLLEDDFKESMLRKRQLWNEAVLKEKRCSKMK